MSYAYYVRYLKIITFKSSMTQCIKLSSFKQHHIKPYPVTSNNESCEQEQQQIT